MRIGQGTNQYSNPTGLGANAKGTSGKNIFQTSARKAADAPKPVTKADAADSPQAHYSKQLSSATSRIYQLQVTPELTKVGDEFVIENEAEFLAEQAKLNELIEEKKEIMKGVLEKHGIKGEITSMAVAHEPGAYAAEYYVETEGDGKNLLILELEDGELVFAETDRRMSGSREDANAWAWDFAVLSHELYGERQHDLSKDELKHLYATFLGADEMKDVSKLKELAMEHQRFDYAQERMKDSVLDIKAARIEA